MRQFHLFRTKSLCILNLHHSSDSDDALFQFARQPHVVGDRDLTHCSDRCIVTCLLQKALTRAPSSLLLNRDQLTVSGTLGAGKEFWTYLKQYQLRRLLSPLLAHIQFIPEAYTTLKCFKIMTRTFINLLLNFLHKPRTISYLKSIMR